MNPDPSKRLTTEQLVDHIEKYESLLRSMILDHLPMTGKNNFKTVRIETDILPALAADAKAVRIVPRLARRVITNLDVQIKSLNIPRPGIREVEFTLNQAPDALTLVTEIKL